MGLCRTCHEFLPPDFMNEDKECEFCKRNSNVLMGGEDSDIMFNKQEVVYDYKQLLGELKDAQGVRDAYIKSVIRKEGLQ